MIKIQRCGECKVTEALWPGNQEAWFYITRMLPGLVGMDGVNYSAIQLVLDVYEVPADLRIEVFEKALVVANALLQKRGEEH